MDEKTARKYRSSGALPSTTKPPRTYRTRPDPFAAVWSTVAERLTAEPRLTAKTLFDWLRAEHPGQFTPRHRADIRAAGASVAGHGRPGA